MIIILTSSPFPKTYHNAHLPLPHQGHPPSIPRIALNEIVRHTTCSANKQHVKIDEWSVFHHILNTASKILSYIPDPSQYARILQSAKDISDLVNLVNAVPVVPSHGQDHIEPEPDTSTEARKGVRVRQI
jgi:hypothetical protein